MMTLAPTAQTNASERSPRIMLYSHDTYGLGHLRRASALAAAITGAIPESSALILTGSPVAGRFAFPDRVDYVRLPGVTKRSDGDYESQTIGMPIQETTELRASIIRATAEGYDPDIVIVDKEPAGFRGEMMPTLDLLRREGRAQIVLGLRDVLDEPERLAAEWSRKGAVETTDTYYHEIWIYGVRSIYDPTKGLKLGPSVYARMHWTGYIRRAAEVSIAPPDGDPYILVTSGGGGDGEAMVDLVLSAYEQDRQLVPNAKIVYGPFLSGETRSEFEARAARLAGRVSTLGFESRMESLFAGASGVVCMGGYNTFCEVLSFDKPAVIVPRTVPRLEQYIRASRAEELGLVRMLDENRDGMTVDAMIRAIRNLASQPLPSAAIPTGLLCGLENVAARVKALLSRSLERAAE